MRIEAPSPRADESSAGSDAVEAWLEHEPRRRPLAIDILKRSHRKSTVVRLHGAGPGGTSVIVKRCPAAVAEVERAVYEQVLPVLPVRTVRLHGASAVRDGSVWLFIEDAGDELWLPERPDHRMLAADWLAAAHVAAAEVVNAIALPDRDLSYFRSLLRSSRATLRAALANDTIGHEGRRVLHALEAGYVALEQAWNQVEELTAPFRRTLALPGFGRKNVRVRAANGRPELLPFDFESAGWGVPAVELCRIDVDRYATCLANAWGPSRSEIHRLAALGTILRTVKAVPGERLALTSAWPHRAIGRLEWYLSTVAPAGAQLEIADWRRSLDD